MSFRLRVYPLAAVLVLFAVVAVAALSTDPGQGRIGGDYPAFYAAGQIADDGAWDDLYDPVVQQEVQAGLVDDDGGFLYFAYPPYVAALYGVMTGLGYSLSFLIQVALMTGALGLALRFMRPGVSAIDAAPLAAFALALFFYPMLTAVVGGQNTAVTLALIAAAAWAEATDRDWAAGVAIGFLFYKPQFAIPLLLLLLVARRWRAAFAAIGTAAALWLAGAVLMGPGWPQEWWREASEFATTNADVNGHLFISLPGALGHLLGGPGTVVGWLLAAAVALALAAVWYRLGREQPWIRYGLAAAGVVLVVPQALFYEAGLLVLPLGILWTKKPERRGWLVVIWLTALAQVAAGTLSFSPLLLTCLVTFAWFLLAHRDLPAGSPSVADTMSV